MIESYLQSLDVAIGDRLPAEIKAQRLREADGHLRMAAGEFNQTEAIRRYGGARAVANAMVRIHRGYETASVWRLSLPQIAVLTIGYAVEFPLLPHLQRLGSSGREISSIILWLLVALYAGLFAFRVAQTRRWLVLPVQLWHVALTTLAILVFSRSSLPYLLSLAFLITVIRASVLYFMINAITLALTSLTDRRKVRRA